jgi:hypothetical protein
MPLSRTSMMIIKWDNDGTAGISASTAQIQKVRHTIGSGAVAFLTTTLFLVTFSAATYNHISENKVAQDHHTLFIPLS